MSVNPLPAGWPEQVPRRLLAPIMDMAGFTICGLLAFQLRFDDSVPAIYAHGMREAIFIWAVAKSAAFFFGAVIPPPVTDENGQALAEGDNLSYWLPGPYTTNNYSNATFFF